MDTKKRVYDKKLIRIKTKDVPFEIYRKRLRSLSILVKKKLWKISEQRENMDP